MRQISGIPSTLSFFSTLSMSKFLRVNVYDNQTAVSNTYWNRTPPGNQPRDFGREDERKREFNLNGIVTRPRVIAPSPDTSMRLRRVYLSKFGSTSPPVTFDKLNSTAMISCVLVSTAICSFRQTLHLPSVPFFLLSVHLRHKL